jgi:hypothetical protein
MLLPGRPRFVALPAPWQSTIITGNVVPRDQKHRFARFLETGPANLRHKEGV